MKLYITKPDIMSFVCGGIDRCTVWFDYPRANGLDPDMFGLYFDSLFYGTGIEWRAFRKAIAKGANLDVIQQHVWDLVVATIDVDDIGNNNWLGEIQKLYYIAESYYFANHKSSGIDDQKFWKDKTRYVHSQIERPGQEHWVWIGEFEVDLVLKT